MKFKRLFRVIIGLFIILAAFVGFVSISHPIILKWLCGSARLIGKPINAIVYTNGRVNNDIKVFHVDKCWGNNERANNYLISLKEFDSLGMLKFFNINLNEKWIGRPIGTSKKEYDFIMGRLFQSETGGHFTPFQDDIKGYNFDPHLLFTDSQIKFNVPSNLLKFDSVRIELK